MQPQGINDTLLNRLLFRAIYRLMTNKLIRRWVNHRGRVVFAFPRLCIKSTGFTTLAEAQAMRFVSQNTTIPVPHVHCAFKLKGRVYIVMERIEGRDLSIGWVQRSEESKARILNQLKFIMEELRSIPPPEDVGIANVSGGPIYDQRLPKKSAWGPFSSIREFHTELRNGIPASDVNGDETVAPGLNKLIAFHEQEWPRPVFTHGDLSSLNVLAQGDKITGIIDWETAGWMPPYWEYTSAWHVNPQNMFWQQEVDKFLTPLPYELEMEIIRRKYFGDF
ncbi:hypothetical protein TOPH_08912 [Tolypocladium ophioglossoides CBS 100239]|uniref:Aminoglycoside phosphotransferase domain-containing protein n=1 Tax=Tolypocladium ophioglossoides (strain CBS 100239) TaxID=1163406 RepID=A0A0L0MX89_TOLOC|nr:hypothetical protein TOPH_08912 [Tolypocladium ophioglossoides CBS 100239]